MPVLGNAGALAKHRALAGPEPILLGISIVIGHRFLSALDVDDKVAIGIAEEPRIYGCSHRPTAPDVCLWSTAALGSVSLVQPMLPSAFWSPPFTCILCMLNVFSWM